MVIPPFLTDHNGYGSGQHGRRHFEVDYSATPPVAQPHFQQMGDSNPLIEITKLTVQPKCLTLLTLFWSCKDLK
jgi:hypothetical protein